jgi:site-specific recombinase XerD
MTTKDTRTLQAVVLAYIGSQQKSPNTLSTMGSALNRLITVAGADLLIVDLTTDHLIDYRQMLLDDDLKFKSCRTYTALAVRFFKYLILREWATFSQGDLDRAKEVLDGMNGRPPEELPKLPDEESVQAIIRLAEEDTRRDGTDRQQWAAMRTAAMLHAMRSTGVRVQELLDLNCGDIHQEGDRAWAMVTGKGSKQRLVFFDPESTNWLRGWLYDHPDGGDDAAIFIRLDRRAPGYETAMSSESVRWILRALCSRAGVRRITPHQFRHRFGTALYIATGLGETADLMGHADPNTTRVYVQLAKQHLQSLHARASL